MKKKDNLLIIRQNEIKHILFDIVFIVYLVTTNIVLVSESVSAIMQNIAYLMLIFLDICEKRFKFKISTFCKIYGGFIVFCFLSLMWTTSVDDTLILLRIMAKVYVASIFVTHYYDSYNGVKHAFKAVYISLILVVIFVVVMAKPTDWTMGSVGKDMGIDTVRFAVRCMICATLGIYYFHNERRKIDIVIALSMFIISLLTGKRTGLLFIFVALVGYYLILQRRLSKKVRNFAILIVVAVLFYNAMYNVEILYESIGVRFEEFISAMLSGTSSDASIVERSKIMSLAWMQFLKSPLVGNGLNSLRPYLMSVNFSHVTYAHNNMLEIAAGLGVVGVLLYYSLYVYAFLKGRKILKICDDRLCILCMMLLLSLFACDFIQVIYESYFEIILLALLVNGLCVIYQDKYKSYRGM